MTLKEQNASFQLDLDLYIKRILMVKFHPGYQYE